MNSPCNMTPADIAPSNTIPLNIIQIVRRYGPVGGMERYVWELSKELADAGHQVTVLCESLCADHAPEHVNIIAFGSIRKKPRWLAHLRFSRKVSQWVQAHPASHRIIHSHERTNVHHCTTFHGPPFAKVKEKIWWKRISPRIAANLYLEQRELCGQQVQAIIPNSQLIADALLHYYPQTYPHLTAPITPGVGLIPQRPNRPIPMDAGVIGFVGKEWKRKGLDIAIAIVTELRRQRPNLTLIVAGPAPDTIRHLFKHLPSAHIQLLGETDSTPLYSQFDLLLHPARQEPYGMVIAEARAAAVPVLVSDACGIASELDDDAIIKLHAPIADWVQAAEQLLQRTSTTVPVTRSWKHVAHEHLGCYQMLLKPKQG